MSSTLNKIHVTNSTGLSLNDRFTAISSQPKVVTNIGNARRSRSRSRSVQRQLPIVKNEQVSSRANQRLLAQLQRKHKMHAALKLKRRSMRTVGGGGASNSSGANGRIQRGSVKAFRVGANGKPMRANSFARVATMKADNESLRTRNVPLRRTNSSGNIANRLGPRRPTVGGAAQRVAKRNIERQRGRNGGGNGRLTTPGRSGGLNVSRGRSRSRSRTRVQPANGRSRSRSNTRNVDTRNNNRNRNQTRNRNPNDATNAPVRRGRSRSHTRGRGGIINKAKATLPVKARLGVRPGQNNNRRNASITRRGVQTGRVEKRLNSTNANGARATAGNNNRRGRPRSRSVVRNATNNNSNMRPRTRSRTRKGQVGQQRQQGAGQQQQPQPQQRNNRAPRGRSQQRRASNGKGQTQQRRGRSRSRTGRGGNGGARNQGNKPPAATKTAVNKDELDKELDQYMATTKTENEMDYLLKN